MASELQVGKVGVGVTPSQHLHIDDSTKPNILLTRTAGVADTTTEMGTVFFGNHDTSKYLCAINGVQDGVKASGKLTFATQPDGGSRTTRMTIDSVGKIAITNNVPMWSGSYGGALVLKGNNATAARHAQLGIVDSSGALVKDGLIVDTNGNVLIGTSTEGEATADNLTIADTGHCGITLRSGTGSVGTMFFSDGTSGTDEYRGYVQYDHSGNFLKWATDGVERMRIDSSGNMTVNNSSNMGLLTGSADNLSLADDATIQVSDAIAGAMLLHIYEVNDGYGGLIFATYNGAPVVLADPANVFSAADTDTKICVTKSATSHDVYIKNRLGATKNFRVLTTAGNIS